MLTLVACEHRKRFNTSFPTNKYEPEMAVCSFVLHKIRRWWWLLIIHCVGGPVWRRKRGSCSCLLEMTVVYLNIWFIAINCWCSQLRLVGAYRQVLIAFISFVIFGYFSFFQLFLWTARHDGRRRLSPEMRSEIRTRYGNQSPDSPAAVFTSTGTAWGKSKQFQRLSHAYYTALQIPTKPLNAKNVYFAFVMKV